MPEPKTGKEVARQEALSKYNTIKVMLTRPDVQKGLTNIMNKYVSADRLFQVVMMYVRENEKLLECSQSSLVAGIMGIFKLGLDPTLKQIHLIPFWNSKKKMFEAQLMIDYRGKIVLMRRNGEMANISAHVVYQKDQFKCLFGTEEFIEHTPSEEEDPGEVRGAYAVITMKDGTKKQDYMPLKQIEKRMAMSKTVDMTKTGPVARDGTPWKEWFEEQAIKTVIHHISKQIPMSVEERLADQLEDRAISGESQFDLLPGGIDGIPVDETSPVVVFDNKASEIVPKDDLDLWGQYLEATAQANKKTIDEIKAELKDEVDGVFKAFLKYKEKKAKKNGADKKEDAKVGDQKDLKLT